MAVLSILQAVNQALRQEMARDESVIVMGQDVGKKGGVFRVTEGLYAEFGEDRVIDTPLNELGIVGAAIGASINGMRPVAEIQFADYIHPAMDQIANEAGKMRYRSGGEFNCPLVVRAPYGGGIHGGVYHSQSVEAIYAHIPGLKVVAPSTPADTKGLLISAIRDDDPVLFFEHKWTYRRIREEVPEEIYEVPIGKADVKRQGDDLTFVTYGAMVHRCLEVAEQLAGDGISAEVLDLRTVSPIDREAVAESVRKTSKVVIVHEDQKIGGVGAEVAAFIAEELLENLDGPVVRVAGPFVPAMPYNVVLEETYLPGVDDIAAAARRLADY